MNTVGVYHLFDSRIITIMNNDGGNGNHTNGLFKNSKNRRKSVKLLCVVMKLGASGGGGGRVSAQRSAG